MLRKKNPYTTGRVSFVPAPVVEQPARRQVAIAHTNALSFVIVLSSHNVAATGAFSVRCAALFCFSYLFRVQPTGDCRNYQNQWGKGNDNCHYAIFLQREKKRHNTDYGERNR